MNKGSAPFSQLQNGGHMILLLKVVALIFAGLSFLAYGWWGREDLNLLEKLLWLSPAIGLLIVGVIPFSLLISIKRKILPTLILLFGIAQTLKGIVSAVGASIEPDTPAAILRLIILVILSIGIYVTWRPNDTFKMQ